MGSFDWCAGLLRLPQDNPWADFTIQVSVGHRKCTYASGGLAPWVGINYTTCRGTGRNDMTDFNLE